MYSSPNFTCAYMTVCSILPYLYLEFLYALLDGNFLDDTSRAQYVYGGSKDKRFSLARRMCGAMFMSCFK